MWQAPEVSAQNITTDGTLGPGGNVEKRDNTYTIEQRLGRLVGRNLFHSFGQFNLNSDETARFTGSSTVQNIVARVTGGASSIDGTIASDIAGANLYLMNPAGVLFGSNAKVDVSGAFHVTTANHIKLADGGVFYADPQRASTLTSAAPAAFGFLNGANGRITLDGSSITFAPGQATSLTASAIEMSNGASIEASGANVSMVTRNTAGELQLDASTGRVSLPAQRSGTINLSDFSTVTMTDGGAQGGIFISTGDLRMSDAAGVVVQSDRGSSISTGQLSVQANNATLLSGSYLLGQTLPSSRGQLDAITVDIADRLLIDGSRFRVGPSGIYSYNYSFRPAQPVQVNARHIALTNRGQIASAVWRDVAQAPALNVNASESIFISNGRLVSESFALGAAGNVRVTSPNINLQDGGMIGSIAQADGAGSAGTVDVRASNLLQIQGGVNFTNQAGGIYANSFADGNAGTININAGRMILSQGSVISVAAQVGSDGDAGTINVTAGDIQATGALFDANLYNSRSFTRGRIRSAGNINLNGNNIDLLAGSSLFASVIRDRTVELGNAGNIKVNATGRLNVQGYTFIQGWPFDRGFRYSGMYAINQTGGDGGSVIVNANQIYLGDFAGITVVNAGLFTGDDRSGLVELNAKDSIIIDNAGVSAAAGSLSIGGTIRVRTPSLIVRNDGIMSVEAGVGGRKIGGLIDIQAGQMVVDNAAVSSRTRGTAAGGDIQIQVDDLRVVSGGVISSQANARGSATDPIQLGRGGAIRIQANGQVLVEGRNSDGDRSRIGADTDPRLEDTPGFGNAGSVSINAARIVVRDDGQVSSRSTQSVGNSGSVQLTATELIRVEGGTVSTSTNASGNAGDVSLTAPVIQLTNGANVSSVAEEGSTGKGGTVNISANQRLELSNAATLSVASLGQADAGNLNISAAQLRMSNSTINSLATSADGGNIRLTMPNDGQASIVLVGSEISTAVQSGRGNGGNIFVNRPGVVFLRASRISANAFGGNGGNILLSADQLISAPNSSITASSTLGVDGQIVLDAQLSDLSRGLPTLGASFDRSNALLNRLCDVRFADDASSLVFVPERKPMRIANRQAGQPNADAAACR